MSKKISELTAASALTGTELVEVVQSATNKRTTTQAIADLAGGGSTIASGTYTPTLTGVANVSSSGANVSQYIRVGSVVHVSGYMTINPTAGTTLTTIRITLPIASDLSSNPHLAGTGNTIAGGAGAAGYLKPDTTNNEAEFNIISTGVTTHNVWYVFTYRIL